MMHEGQQTGIGHPGAAWKARGPPSTPPVDARVKKRGPGSTTGGYLHAMGLAFDRFVDGFLMFGFVVMAVWAVKIATIPYVGACGP